MYNALSRLATFANSVNGRDAIASLLPGIMGSQDAAEGLRSFLERREAHFTGH